MNKSEMIKGMAEKAEMTAKQAGAAYEAFVATLAEALKSGDKVTLVGFGTFQAKTRPAREGINPRTGEKLTIAAATVPSFKAGKSFKDDLGK